ncbi:hypothetical protein [Haloprofundus salilacus]|uniref:hypothetical protein n=1 Tax=Haloprofundus salilacus TaxID=2876190 RepID=UPI001CCBC30D|nr:hypothetical protein [Haloprofundus salilacus]
MPDSAHVVVHTDWKWDGLESFLEELLRTVSGLLRCGFVISDDTMDTACGSVYWLDDSGLVESARYSDRSEGDSVRLSEDEFRKEALGFGMTRRIRDALDFEIYTWWDFSVDGMAMRYWNSLDSRVAGTDSDESVETE